MRFQANFSISQKNNNQINHFMMVKWCCKFIFLRIIMTIQIPVKQTAYPALTSGENANDQQYFICQPAGPVPVCRVRRLTRDLAAVRSWRRCCSARYPWRRIRRREGLSSFSLNSNCFSIQYVRSRFLRVILQFTKSRYKSPFNSAHSVIHSIYWFLIFKVMWIFYS